MGTPQPAGQPTGIRDQWIGKVKFAEKIYTCTIPIHTVAVESEEYLARIGFSTSRCESEYLIEVVVTGNGITTPWVVSIARIGDGFRISFLRVRALRQILQTGKDNAGALAASALVIPGLAVLLGAGTALNAGLESIFETKFWTYIDARIHELAPQVTSQSIVSGTQQDSASQLEKLWQLKQQGALTQEEFEAAKKDLLSKS